MRNLLLFALLLRLVPLAAALFQLIGTALIFWGLRITTDRGVSNIEDESSNRSR
jgi:hypothetical protein